jgi:hypothetical protein
MATLGSVFQQFPRSREAARDLQASQVVMGVPGQVPAARSAVRQGTVETGEGLRNRLATVRAAGEGPMPIGAGRGLSPTSQAVISTVTSQREQQQQLVQARAQDLNVAQRLLQVTSPQLGKEARGFLLDGLSRELGVDPRTDYYKGLKKVILNLDPDNGQALRGMFTAQLDEAQPGQVTQGVRAVLTGDMPLDQLITRASTVGRGMAAQRQAEAAAVFDGPPADDGMRGLGGPRGFGVSMGGQSMVTPVQAPAGAPSGSSLVPRYRESTTPPRLREVAPELAQTLGFDPTVRYRNLDVLATHPRIPSDFEGQQRVATELQTVDSAVSDAIRGAAAMVELSRGRPEALRLLPNTPIWENPATFTRELVGTLDGLRRLLGYGTDDATSTGELSPRSRFVLEQATTRFLDNMGIGDALRTIGGYLPPLPDLARVPERFRDASGAYARVQGEMYKLAYALARAADPGGRLSDQDIEVQLRRIGDFSSPELMQQSLTQVMGQLFTERNQLILSRTGGAAPLALTPEIRQLVAQSGIAPAELTADPAAAPQRAQPQLRTGGVQSIEEQEAAERAQLQAERDRVARGEAREVERLGFARSEEARAERGEQRQLRLDEERRRQRVQEAFQAIGRALAGSIQGGGGGGSVGSMGGDQDPNAFRITPAPQRRPPTPVPAAPYQPQAPAFRRR